MNERRARAQLIDGPVEYRSEAAAFRVVMVNSFGASLRAEIAKRESHEITTS
jgi:hypothetical protein